VSVVEHEIQLPVFPVRNAVFFPGMVSLFDVGRRSTLAAVDEASRSSPSLILVLAQRDPIAEDPQLCDLYAVGCIAEMLKRLPNIQGGYRVVLHGQQRVALRAIASDTPHLRATVSALPAEAPLTHPQRTLVEEIREGAEVLARAEGVPDEALEILHRTPEPENLVNLVAGNVSASVGTKAEWLAAPLAERIRLVLEEIRLQVAALKEK
jgi:ATP-dependent Lon protease